MDLDAIGKTIAASIDGAFAQSYASHYVGTTQSAKASGLTLASLRESLAAFREYQECATRTFWYGLALKHGPHTLLLATESTIAQTESLFALEAAARPPFVRVSRCMEPHTFVFLRCPCICHEPRQLFGLHTNQQRVLTPSGNWCCTCSAYEDIE